MNNDKSDIHSDRARYIRRAKVEAAIRRWKQVIGDNGSIQNRGGIRQLLTELDHRWGLKAWIAMAEGILEGSDGVDAPRRHRCAKVEVLKTPLEGGVRDRS